MTGSVDIVEVGPRDGFQSISPFIPSAQKIDIIDRLYAAGVRRMETTSFVSQNAVPQMADAADIVSATARLDQLDGQVLVPSTRHAERALAAGARHLSVVLSVSEQHNMGNIRRTPAESVSDYASIVAMAPSQTALRLNVATAFDCPHTGRMEAQAVFELLADLVAVTNNVEIALCDTTGRADPAQIRALFTSARNLFPDVRGWAFHGHDTFGLGAANVLAAFDVGIRTFDASIAGLGGCPFAPGATGNVATEDLAWMFHRMGIETGLDLDLLIDTAGVVANLSGAQIGGRVRDAFASRRCETGH